MAERIEYTPPPNEDLDPSAHEELERLLQTLHRQGVLRFANDVVGSEEDLARTLINALNRESSLNAIQNLSSLFLALSSIPPGRFYKTVFALRDAAAAVEAGIRSDREDDAAPGLSGTYHLLKDETLWKSITPLLDGLKVFHDAMDRDVERPISDLKNKPSNFQ